MIILLPVSPQKGHPDQAMSCNRILNYLSVPRFEDMQGKTNLGKENHVVKRKNRDDTLQTQIFRFVSHITPQ